DGCAGQGHCAQHSSPSNVVRDDYGSGGGFLWYEYGYLSAEEGWSGLMRTNEHSDNPSRAKLGLSQDAVGPRIEWLRARGHSFYQSPVLEITPPGISLLRSP